MDFIKLIEQELESLEEAKLRLVTTEKSGNNSAKVYFDSEVQEYRVRFFRGNVTREAEDYFTDDKQDALGTAKYQLKRM